MDLLEDWIIIRVIDNSYVDKSSQIKNIESITFQAYSFSLNFIYINQADSF